MRKERKKHTDFLLKLGLNIRYYRTLQGFTQKELAARSRISPGHVAKLENPNYVIAPSINVLFRIAAALRIPMSRLMNVDFKLDDEKGIE